MLGSKTEACQPPRHDLTQCQRRSHDLSVGRSGLGGPSETKKGGETLDPQRRHVDVYGDMAGTHPGDVVSRASERARDIRIFSGTPLATDVSTNGREGGGKE